MTALDQARPRGAPMLGLGLGVAALILVADQLTKWWVLAAFDGAAERGRAIASFFNLVLVWNRGVSFGMFNNDARLNALVFSALAAVIVIALLVWLSRTRERLLGAAIGLVTGGAIGNVVDRLRFGAVVDFLDFHAAGWHWPAFNVADAAICVGVALMALDGLLVKRESRS